MINIVPILDQSKFKLKGVEISANYADFTSNLNLLGVKQSIYDQARADMRSRPPAWCYQLRDVGGSGDTSRW